MNTKKRSFGVPGNESRVDLRPFVGVGGGVAAFGGAILVGLALPFAAAAGMIVFGAGYLLTPRPKEPSEVFLAPEVTQEMLTAFLARGNQGLDWLRELNLQIEGPLMNRRVEELCIIVEQILETCQKDPQDIRAARSFDYWLEKIAEYLGGYIEVAGAVSKIKDDAMLKRLRSTEQMIERITHHFGEIYKAMIENDLRKVESTSGALSMEFGDGAPADASS